MSQEYITRRGARENNLKNVSLRIPKRKITIFTGVSGSGKSSIVFDTIASEARRQLNETFSVFARNFLPRYAQLDADAIENLSMAIVVDQKHLGGGSHSTVGTITDIYSVLRLLYSRIGQPFVGYSNAFSFNDPQGMCPDCNGIGRKIGVDLDKFLDTSGSLNGGAILFPEYAVESWGWNILTQSGLFDNDKYAIRPGMSPKICGSNALANKAHRSLRRAAQRPLWLARSRRLAAKFGDQADKRLLRFVKRERERIFRYHSCAFLTAFIKKKRDDLSSYSQRTRTNRQVSGIFRQ